MDVAYLNMEIKKAASIPCVSVRPGLLLIDMAKLDEPYGAKVGLCVRVPDECFYDAGAFWEAPKTMNAGGWLATADNLPFENALQKSDPRVDVGNTDNGFRKAGAVARDAWHQ